MLWIPATLAAATLQTARNAMQSKLTAALGTLGATQVRFVYGWPFAAAFLALTCFVGGTAVPAPTPAFLAYTVGGALAQIGGTALLLAAMHARSFAVATALSKTEALQVALFGMLLLGEHLTPLRGAAVALATSGVLLMTVRVGGGATTVELKTALCGIASGGLFALASVGFRGAILALGDDAYYLRAATALTWALGLQTVLLGAWMAAFDRRALVGSFKLWRQSLLAGLLGASASELWFLAFSLTAAANVRTLALIEVLFAQGVSRRLFGHRATPRELLGTALLVAGLAVLLATTARSS
jgi:drug/metabolite transporter (DMT)-like permease